MVKGWSMVDTCFPLISQPYLHIATVTPKYYPDEALKERKEERPGCGGSNVSGVFFRTSTAFYIVSGAFNRVSFLSIDAFFIDKDNREPEHFREQHRWDLCLHCVLRMQTNGNQQLHQSFLKFCVTGGNTSCFLSAFIHHIA